MFSKYSSEQSVQIFDYWYFVACIFQSAWTFAFGYEIIWLSVVCMGGILVSLYQIVNLQNGLGTDAATFWLFQFPFSIHCGWIAAAFGVNFNVWPVSAGIQNIAIPYVTLIYAVGVAIYALFGFGGPDYTIPCVLMWALFGITAELKNPKDSIVRSFSEGQIASFGQVCTWLIVLLAVGTSIVGYMNSSVVVGTNFALATAAVGGYKIFKKRKNEQGDYQRI